MHPGKRLVGKVAIVTGGASGDRRRDGARLRAARGEGAADRQQRRPGQERRKRDIRQRWYGGVRDLGRL